MLTPPEPMPPARVVWEGREYPREGSGRPARVVVCVGRAVVLLASRDATGSLCWYSTASPEIMEAVIVALSTSAAP